MFHAKTVAYCVDVYYLASFSSLRFTVCGPKLRGVEQTPQTADAGRAELADAVSKMGGLLELL
jgi:hypothetical protein